MSAASPTAKTRLIALLGDPVAHSLSPVFQNAAIQHLRHDAVYLALRCDAVAAAALLRAIGRAGGGGNVTVPHKAIAAQCIERPTELVRRTAACNTFWSEDGVLCGDNTDVAGFRFAARQLLPDLAGSSVLILGAGGAAAATVCALLDDGAARITLYNRSPDRAYALAARFDPAQRIINVALSVASLAHERYDLVVNASPAGLRHNEPLPLDLDAIQPPRAVLDLVYRDGATTAWVRAAQRLDIPALDGLEMLIGQGAAAFEHWFAAGAPIGVMRAALQRS